MRQVSYLASCRLIFKGLIIKPLYVRQLMSIAHKVHKVETDQEFDSCLYFLLHGVNLGIIQVAELSAACVFARWGTWRKVNLQQMGLIGQQWALGHLLWQLPPSDSLSNRLEILLNQLSNHSRAPVAGLMFVPQSLVSLSRWTLWTVCE